MPVTGILDMLYKYTRHGQYNGTANCIITLKDHKANFLNYPTKRLINPTKNEIGCRIIIIGNDSDRYFRYALYK